MNQKQKLILFFFSLGLLIFTGIEIVYQSTSSVFRLRGSQPFRNEGTVVKLPIQIHQVVDGDTLKIILNHRIYLLRLEKVDTFETRSSKKAKSQAKYFHLSLSEVLERGKQAKQFVSQAVFDWKNKKTKMQLKILKTNRGFQKDAYQRLLGDLLYGEKENSLAENLLDQNLGYPYLGRKLYRQGK